MPTRRQTEDFISSISADITISNSALDTALNWIVSNLDPDDVFTETQLEKWAEANGYVKNEQ